MLDTKINDRYLIQSELGRGGMGIVYRAHDLLLERDVAVKVLSTGEIGSQGRARLLREAQAAARLNHPNIINVYDAGDIDGKTYIVMELLDGDSLFDRKPESLDETLQIMRQVCDALEHAHQHGIIHRDLKPENVIVTSQGVAKLTDFGLSRSLSQRATQENIIVGTVYYLAPEQALRQEVDCRADLYALGVMMYEMVTGRLPFTADDPLAVITQHLNATVVPPSTHNSLLPPRLDALIVRLLSKQPEGRPSTAAEVKELLDHIYDADVDGDAYLPGLSPLDRLARGRLVGRQAEFNQVRSRWEEISSGRGGENVVVISGEPGVGKTPLIKEIRSLAYVSGARAFLGECYLHGGATYLPIIQILQEAQPLPENLPDLVLADLKLLAPDLVTHALPENVPLSPLSNQQRMFESLFALFATLAERQPMVLIVEDVQWADGNTLYLLRHMARRARSTRMRLMIVLTYRPGEVGENDALRNVLLDLTQERLCLPIDLLPFSREQTRELLAAMFMQEISDHFLNAIYNVTEGNLFFIEEIIKTLIEEGKLYYEGGQWQLDGPEELEMPRSVRLTLEVRLQRLPEQAQDVLRLAAFIGREFDFAILSHASDDDEDTLIEALEMAERAQLIDEVPASRRSSKRAESDRFAFAHALIPNILREQISTLRKRRIHRRIAEAIETVYPDDLEMLAYHYIEAGNREKARFYTIQSGDRARKLYANTEALRFYNEALQLCDDNPAGRFRILESRAQVYNVLAQRDQQREDIAAMLEIAEETKDELMRCDALIAMADLFLVTEYLTAREPALEAAAIAQKLNDPIREARALRSVGWAAYIRHDYHESLSALESAVTRFRQANQLAMAAECLHMLSLVTGPQGLGEMEISIKYAKDAIQLSRMAGDPRQEAISLRRLAIVAMDQRAGTDPLSTARQALNLHRELGDRNEECMALNVLGVTEAWLGQKEDALAHLHESLALAKAINSNMGIWIAYSNLQWLYFGGEGLYEAALAFADEHLALPGVDNDPFMKMNLQVSKAGILAGLGMYSQALENLAQAQSIAGRFASPVVQADFYVMAAEYAAEAGDFQEAHRMIEKARELSNNFERPNDLARLLAMSAKIAWREWQAGRRAKLAPASGQIDQALNLLRGTQWAVEYGDALQTAALIALSCDQFEKALAFSEESIRIFSGMPVKPDGYEYVHACALWANERNDEAADFLERAYQRIMLVARNIQNEDLRRSWLENVRLNREIIEDME